MIDCPCCPARFTVPEGAELTCPGCQTTLPEGWRYARQQPHDIRRSAKSQRSIFEHHGNGDRPGAGEAGFSSD